MFTLLALAVLAVSVAVRRGVMPHEGVITRPELDPTVARWIESLPGAEHPFDVSDARIYRLPQLDAVPGA